jgi:hypothetical protein
MEKRDNNLITGLLLSKLNKKKFSKFCDFSFFCDTYGRGAATPLK